MELICVINHRRNCHQDGLLPCSYAFVVPARDSHLLVCPGNCPTDPNMQCSLQQASVLCLILPRIYMAVGERVTVKVLIDIISLLKMLRGFQREQSTEAQMLA